MHKHMGALTTDKGTREGRAPLGLQGPGRPQRPFPRRMARGTLDMERLRSGDLRRPSERRPLTDRSTYGGDEGQADTYPLHRANQSGYRDRPKPLGPAV